MSRTLNEPHGVEVGVGVGVGVGVNVAVGVGVNVAVGVGVEVGVGVGVGLGTVNVCECAGNCDRFINNVVCPAVSASANEFPLVPAGTVAIMFGTAKVSCPSPP